MKCMCAAMLAAAVFLLVSCGPGNGNELPETRMVPEKAHASDPNDLPEKPAKVPALLINHPDTLVRADAYSKAIFWELKYATADNFMHRVLYDTLKAVYIQKDIAVRLAKCQEALTKIDPDLHLLVYDGVRPLSVQREMWTALDTIPVAQRGKFVSNPRNGSVHNYGAAVDITICNANREPLDMGAGYDDIRQIAYPSLEAQFLASGELTNAQLANRQLLRKIMRSQGFLNIPTEWWHFNAYPRAVVKGKYRIVENEL